MNDRELLQFASLSFDNMLDDLNRYVAGFKESERDGIFTEKEKEIIANAWECFDDIERFIAAEAEKTNARYTNAKRTNCRKWLGRIFQAIIYLGTVGGAIWWLFGT